MELKNYIATVIKFDNMDDDIVTVLIDEIVLTCYCYGLNKNEVKIGDKWIISLDILDFYENSIKEIERGEKCATPLGKSLSYILKGIYDADNQTIDIGILLDINSDKMYNYSYLDKKNITISILRFDIEFVNRLN